MAYCRKVRNDDKLAEEHERTELINGQIKDRGGFAEVARLGQLTDVDVCATLNERECYLFFLSTVTKIEIIVSDRLSISYRDIANNLLFVLEK